MSQLVLPDMKQWLIDYKLTVRDLANLVGISNKIMEDIIEGVVSPRQKTIKNIINVMENISPMQGNRFLKTKEVICNRFESAVFDLMLLESPKEINGSEFRPIIKQIRQDNKGLHSLLYIRHVIKNRHIMCSIQNENIILTEACLIKIGFKPGDQFDESVVNKVIDFIEKSINFKCKYCKFVSYSFFGQPKYRFGDFCTEVCKEEHEELYGP